MPIQKNLCSSYIHSFFTMYTSLLNFLIFTTEACRGYALLLLSELTVSNIHYETDAVAILLFTSVKVTKSYLLIRLTPR